MKLEKNDRVMAGILVVFVLFCIANWVWADSNHNHYYSTPSSSTVVNNPSSVGIPLAISIANIDFSHTTKKWQGGVGFGFFNSRNAISGGVGKKFKNTLVKVTLGIEEGKLGGGAGIIFQFN